MKIIRISDRERILLNVINLIGTDAGLGAIGKYDAFLRYDVAPVDGDLVLCMTVNVHPVKVGWMVENRGNGCALLREVGTPKLWDFENEKYLKIDYKRTVLADQFTEGEEYRLTYKIRSAVRKLDNYFHRIDSIDFDGPSHWGSQRPCSVTFRGHIFLRSDARYTIPLEWSPRTSVKNLMNQLRAGGYGDDSKLPSRES